MYIQKKGKMSLQVVATERRDAIAELARANTPRSVLPHTSHIFIDKEIIILLSSIRSSIIASHLLHHH
ncbi:unnamed protein product [Arabidopsis halleri]